MLNESWAGRNSTKGCSADWRRRRISDFNKEQYELPEDDLETDRNMLERFKCFNATILD
jgi:hypothetical protein